MGIVIACVALCHQVYFFPCVQNSSQIVFSRKLLQYDVQQHKKSCDSMNNLHLHLCSSCITADWTHLSLVPHSSSSGPVEVLAP